MGKSPTRRRGANIEALFEQIVGDDGKPDPEMLRAVIEQIRGMLDWLPADERKRVCDALAKHCGGPSDPDPDLLPPGVRI